MISASAAPPPGLPASRTPRLPFRYSEGQVIVPPPPPACRRHHLLRHLFRGMGPNQRLRPDLPADLSTERNGGRLSRRRPRAPRLARPHSHGHPDRPLRWTPGLHRPHPLLRRAGFRRSAHRQLLSTDRRGLLPRNGRLVV